MEVIKRSRTAKGRVTDPVRAILHVHGVLDIVIILDDGPQLNLQLALLGFMALGTIYQFTHPSILI